jgi:hypothetical membrane protein
MRNRDLRLLFGPLAAAILAVGIVGLSLMVPDYDQVRQTVSEIGERDSPARIPFALMLCSVAACLIVFALGVRNVSMKAGHGAASAYLIGCMALAAAGVGIFAFPHPLHNIFGESELIGYQAPLAFALALLRTGTKIAIRRVVLLVRWSWPPVMATRFDRVKLKVVPPAPN